jgi:RNA polymerase II subunit A-like phosphatase
LVAAKLGTAKVNDARKRGNIKLVTPDWLWGCAERWEHVDERLYQLCKNSQVTLKPPGVVVVV